MTTRYKGLFPGKWSLVGGTSRTWGLNLSGGLVFILKHRWLCWCSILFYWVLYDSSSLWHDSSHLWYDSSNLCWNILLTSIWLTCPSYDFPLYSVWLLTVLGCSLTFSLLPYDSAPFWLMFPDPSLSFSVCHVAFSHTPCCLPLCFCCLVWCVFPLYSL